LPEIHLLRQDVAKVYNRLPESRLVFCDPPYERGWFERIFELERKFSRVRPDGLLLYEAAGKEPIPADISPFSLLDSKIYGDSTVHFFVKPASE
jgi:16S rRNA G966 N2-methylase RsmD